MLSWLKSAFRSEARDGRRLCKDTDVIIETDRQTCSPKHMLRVAELAREEIERVEKRLARRPKDKPVIRYDVQQRHKNARLAHQNALYTAMTLVLIRMQANELSEHGAPVIKMIEDFLADPLSDPLSDPLADSDKDSLPHPDVDPDVDRQADSAADAASSANSDASDASDVTVKKPQNNLSA